MFSQAGTAAGSTPNYFSQVVPHVLLQRGRPTRRETHVGIHSTDSSFNEQIIASLWALIFAVSIANNQTCCWTWRPLRCPYLAACARRKRQPSLFGDDTHAVVAQPKWAREHGLHSVRSSVSVGGKAFSATNLATCSSGSGSAQEPTFFGLPTTGAHVITLLHKLAPSQRDEAEKPHHAQHSRVVPSTRCLLFSILFVGHCGSVWSQRSSQWPSSFEHGHKNKVHVQLSARAHKKHWMKHQPSCPSHLRPSWTFDESVPQTSFLAHACKKAESQESLRKGDGTNPLR